jgi:hypothetical protein
MTATDDAVNPIARYARAAEATGQADAKAGAMRGSLDGRRRTPARIADCDDFSSSQE